MTISALPTPVSRHSPTTRLFRLQATAPEEPGQPEQQRPAKRPNGSKRRTKLRIRRRRTRPQEDSYSGQDELIDPDMLAVLYQNEMSQRYEQLTSGLSPENLLQLRQQHGHVVDKPQFWEDAVLSGFVWDLLKQQLGPVDAALVTKLFGEDWHMLAELDEARLQEEVMTMSDSDRMRLFSVLTKLTTIQAQVAELAQGQTTAAGLAERLLHQQQQCAEEQQQQAAEARGHADVGGLGDGETIIVGDGSAIDPQDPSASRQWGQWRSRGSSSNRNSSDAVSSGSNGSFGGGAGSRSSSSSMSAADMLAEGVDSFTRHLEATTSGRQQWGQPMSRHFSTLQTIQARLVELESLDPGSLAQHGMDADDFAAAYAYVNEQMAALLSEAGSITDTAARSALIYMDTLTAEGDREPGAAGQFEVTNESLAQLGRFLAAAENLEALKAWARAHASNNPQLPLEQLLQASGLDSDDWFIVSEQRAAAAEAFEAASTSGQGGGRALSRFVDQERIEVLAALNGDVLRFLAELEETNYSQDTLIKWSLHNVVGPKLMSGDWLQEQQLPQMLQVLYKLAREPGAAGAPDVGMNDQESAVKSQDG